MFLSLSLGIPYKAPMAVFSGKNLVCVRGERLLFENLSFSVESGKVLALTGANGCGKTSLMRLMAGLLEPLEGGFQWDRKAVGEEFAAKNILWMGQETPLKTHMTVEENLAFLARLMGAKVGGEKIRATIDKTGLGDFAEYPVQYLSMGQRRRTLLALLFLVKRKIWLIDEPTNHLDKAGREALVEGVRGYLKQGGIVVVATHRPEVWGACEILDVESFGPKAGKRNAGKKTKEPAREAA